MSTKTLYPNTLSQSSGIPYRQFADLSNVKNSKSTYARSKNLDGGIASKAGTYHTPSKITATNFNANIPTGATINSVTVEYAADKEGYLSIGKTTVDLTGVTIDAKNGKALTTTVTKSSVKFTSSNLTVSKVNSSSFGVTIAFPKNSTYNTGYVKVQYIRIIIDYTTPNYTITSKKVAGEYTDETYLIQASISNVNKTASDSTVTITLPSGANYAGKEEGDGSISGDGSLITWKPGLSKSVLSRTVVFRVTFDAAGTYTIQCKEAVTNHTSSVNITTTDRPEPVVEEPDEENETVYIEPEGDEVLTVTVKQNSPFMVSKTLTEEQAADMSTWATDCPVGSFYLFLNPDFEDDFRSFNSSTGKYEYDAQYWLDDGTVYYDAELQLQSVDTSSGNFNVDTVDKITLVLLGGTITESDGTVIADLELARFNLDIFPETLTTPSLTVFQLSQEELNRLGDGYTYTVQTFIKEVTDDTYVRDWGQNFRIGVFNNPIAANISSVPLEGEEQELLIDSTDYRALNISDVFSNAEYWSSPLTSVNAYENLSVSFPYQKQYPVYILITGDYVEAISREKIKFTEPVIVETSDYNGWIRNGNYPIPILDTIKTGTVSQLTIPSFDISDTVIVYNSPVEELVTDDYFIKGISVSFDIEYTDYISLNVRLNTGKGVGERSLVLEPGDVGTITLGGPNDRWNLKPSELVNPEDWEFEIQHTNVFNSDNSQSEVFFNNTIITYYIQKIEAQNVSILVEGEDLAIYDTFINDIDIPAGLETDTDLIHITGTDLNDAYLQTIKEKTITIDLSVMGCNLEESTRALQELTTLLTNERDELNKPIPKRLEISNYPGIHWDFVMKDPLDAALNISDYDVKIKLLIPAGTAYTNEEILTSTVGKVGGIAKVNPKIQLIPLDSHIELLERNSGQKFTMNYTAWTHTDVVVIDCENRIVTMNESTDLTSKVDYGVDWFQLYGEFEFQTTNCLIQTISRYERM